MCVNYMCMHVCVCIRITYTQVVHVQSSHIHAKYHGKLLSMTWCTEKPMGLVSQSQVCVWLTHMYLYTYSHKHTHEYLYTYPHTHTHTHCTHTNLYAHTHRLVKPAGHVPPSQVCLVGWVCGCVGVWVCICVYVCIWIFVYVRKTGGPCVQRQACVWHTHI